MKMDGKMTQIANILENPKAEPKNVCLIVNRDVTYLKLSLSSLSIILTGRMMGSKKMIRDIYTLKRAAIMRVSKWYLKILAVVC